MKRQASRPCVAAQLCHFLHQAAELHTRSLPPTATPSAVKSSYQAARDIASGHILPCASAEHDNTSQSSKGKQLVRTQKEAGAADRGLRPRCHVGAHLAARGNAPHVGCGDSSSRQTYRVAASYLESNHVEIDAKVHHVGWGSGRV